MIKKLSFAKKGSLRFKPHIIHTRSELYLFPMEKTFFLCLPTSLHTCTLFPHFRQEGAFHLLKISFFVCVHHAAKSLPGDLHLLPPILTFLMFCLLPVAFHRSFKILHCLVEKQREDGICPSDASLHHSSAFLPTSPTLLLRSLEPGF